MLYLEVKCNFIFYIIVEREENICKMMEVESFCYWVIIDFEDFVILNKIYLSIIHKNLWEYEYDEC